MSFDTGLRAVVSRWRRHRPSLPLTVAWIFVALGTGPASAFAQPVADAGAPSEIGQSGLYLAQVIALPNLPAGGKFSYDIGVVDPHAHSYYLADRTNKSLDIIDTDTYAVHQVSGFTGVGASNDVSGPDGVVVTPDGVYVGDVNGLKLVDPQAATIVATIPIASSGFRTDEGCYDPDDRLLMFQNPADSPPFATYLMTKDNSIVARLPFADAKGLEACVYDPRTKSFLVNNDGTPTNPHGEVDIIPAWTVIAGNPQVAARYALGNCGPTGIALGRHEEVVVGCDAPAGDPQLTLIMDARTGTILDAVSEVGGEDELAFDPHLGRFYVAARNMTASGESQSGVAGAAFTPVLGVIEAATGAWIANIPTGAGAHSVAVDPRTGRVFVPVPPTPSLAGGVQVYAPIAPVCRP
jgi:hypothetical protein